MSISFSYHIIVTSCISAWSVATTPRCAQPRSWYHSYHLAATNARRQWWPPFPGDSWHKHLPPAAVFVETTFQARDFLQIPRLVMLLCVKISLKYIYIIYTICISSNINHILSARPSKSRPVKQSWPIHDSPALHRQPWCWHPHWSSSSFRISRPYQVLVPPSKLPPHQKQWFNKVLLRENNGS